METLLLFAAFASSDPVPVSAPPLNFSAFAAETNGDEGYTGPAPPGQRWERREGELWKLVPDNKGVGTAPRTFRAGTTYYSGHNCPSCNRSQYYVSGWNRDGTHNHTCSAPNCGTVWSH